MNATQTLFFLVEGAYYAVTQFGFALQFLFLPKGKFEFFSKYQIEFLANVFKSYQGLEFTNLNNALPPQKCDKFLMKSIFFTETVSTCTVGLPALIYQNKNKPAKQASQFTVQNTDKRTDVWS